MKINLSKKINNVDRNVFEPIFTLISEKLNKGTVLLNAAVGIPDSDTPDVLLKTISESVYKKENMRYGDFNGKKSLLQEISNYLKNKYNVDVDPDNEIALLIGTKSGLSALSEILINEDDVVILPTPGYPDYIGGIQLAGGKIIEVELDREKEYLLDFDLIDEEISEQAKLIFLNYPSNPTGAVATHEFFEKAVSWAKKYNVIIAHDHAYADFYYKENLSPSFVEAKDFKEVGVEFFSLSKNFSISGLRIGFVVGNKEIISGFKKYHTIFHANIYGAIQDLAEVALRNSEKLTHHIKDTYKNRLEKISKGLKEIGYDFYAPKGSIFIWLKVKEGFNADSYFKLLLDKYNLITIPGTAFGKGGEEYLRISISLLDEQIEELLYKLKKAYEEN